MTSPAPFQVRVIRDIVGTTYAVVDTCKPEFANGHSNSLGCWTDLAVAQSIADSENKKVSLACLKAAAPDLLAALEAVDNSGELQGRAPDKLIALVRAAIAKAQGFST